ncbi:MAG: subtype I-B CRISPR-associated endonuclease Cas1 [Epulopiscium sp. Nele67-Bin005]|nr:MAG: subtype I-B CRISPR-associated endonuclease Cas1 [Epulopiscium sp. Nele67-Bin005]
MNKNYYFFNEGRLKREDNTLKLIYPDGTKRDIPIESIDDIYIMCEMDLNVSLLNFLGSHKISIHFFDYYTNYRGSFYPKESYISGELLTKQTMIYSDNALRLELAKKFIQGATANIIRNLRYYKNRKKDVEQEMERIISFEDKIAGATSIRELMGYEGNVRKIYYSAWPQIINQELEFKKRVKNPPDYEVNTLISCINDLIYTAVLREIYKTQLNPTISYLHSAGNKRFSLALDIAEIFKPVLADRMIFSLINKSQITEDSFTPNLNGLQLTKKASNTILREFDKRMKKTVKHKDLNKNVSYQYLIRLECYKLVNHMIGVKSYEPFKIWW